MSVPSGERNLGQPVAFHEEAISLAERFRAAVDADGPDEQQEALDAEYTDANEDIIEWCTDNGAANLRTLAELAAEVAQLRQALEDVVDYYDAGTLTGRILERARAALGVSRPGQEQEGDDT